MKTKIVENKAVIKAVIKAANEYFKTDMFVHTKFKYIQYESTYIDFTKFRYGGVNFCIKYVSGCFYPYLFEIL